MNEKIWRYAALMLILLAVAFGATSAAVGPAAAAAPKAVTQRLLINTKSVADHAALRADLQRAGAKVVIDHPEINFMVVTTNNPGLKAMISKNSHVVPVAPQPHRTDRSA